MNMKIENSAQKMKIVFVFGASNLGDAFIKLLILSKVIEVLSCVFLSGFLPVNFDTSPHFEHNYKRKKGKFLKVCKKASNR